MDIQEPREAIQEGRLGSTTKYRFVPITVSRGFDLIDPASRLGKSRSTEGWRIWRQWVSNVLRNWGMMEFEPSSGFYSVFSVTESPYVSSGGRILHIVGRFHSYTI